MLLFLVAHITFVNSVDIFEFSKCFRTSLSQRQLMIRAKERETNLLGNAEKTFFILFTRPENHTEHWGNFNNSKCSA